MAQNTSASGGYLAPAALPELLEGNSFEDFLQEVIAGISAIPPELVRPAWQPEPPNQPDFDVDWVAINIVSQQPDTYAYTQHDVDGNGTDYLFRQEDVEVLLSAIGPNSQRVMARIYDGFQVEQNRAVLVENAVGQTAMGRITAAPMLKKTQWVKRFDMNWYFKRAIRRFYPILTILSAQGTIHANKYDVQVIDTPFLVTNS